MCDQCRCQMADYKVYAWTEGTDRLWEIIPNSWYEYKRKTLNTATKNLIFCKNLENQMPKDVWIEVLGVWISLNELVQEEEGD